MMKTPLVPWEAKFIRSHSVLFGGYLWRFEQEFAINKLFVERNIGL